MNLGVWDYVLSWTPILIRLFLTFVSGSNESQCDVMLVSQLRHFLTVLQITLGSMKLSFIKGDWLLSCLWNETFLQSVNFMLPKVVGILLKINLHAFCPFWVFFILIFCTLLYWNQMDVVYRKWIVIIVMVLSIPVIMNIEMLLCLWFFRKLRCTIYSWGMMLHQWVIGYTW